VATKYGIISKGHVIKEITATELQEELAKTTDIVVDKPEELTKLIGEILPDSKISYIPDGVRIAGEFDFNATLRAIIDADIHIISINCHETIFEDYYLETIGGKRV
jgi:ABC-2 type transport system ATP-binding protein